MKVDDIFDQYDDDAVTREKATELLLSLGYGVERIKMALDIADQGKARDHVIANKIVALVQRHADPGEWMKELGRDYGRAVFLWNTMLDNRAKKVSIQ